MKKKALLASMMIMAAVSLAGCSGNSATKAADSSVTTGNEATESSATDSSAADSQTASDTKASETKENTDTTTEEPADPDADSSASGVAAADDDVSYAAAFIGVSMDEFKETFGQPTSSSVSTNDAGEELRTYTYDNFTVTTHTDSDGTEVIDDVE